MYALLLLWLACALAYAQAVTATLLGTISDTSGAVISAARVTITESATGVSHTGQSNGSGNYVFPNVPPGRYQVAVEVTGFKKELRPDITVLVDTTTRVDVQLQAGDVKQSVDVVAAPPLLQADSASTSQKIESAVVVNAPLAVNRNFQSLINLVPGSSPVVFDHSQFYNAEGSLQTEVNGQMRFGNNYMIEGTDDNTRAGNLQIYIPAIEAIETVDVSTSNHDAELGRASAGVINVLLRSGSNALHGSAYEFLQNNALDSRSFFNPSVGHIAYNYVGGSLAGPIKKNKLFFFGDYLRTMDHEANTNLVTVPSSPWRTGDLSSALGLAKPVIVYDPNTGNPLDGTNRTAFPNNQIPSSRINPVSAAILNLVPSPNLSYNAANPTNNYFALLPFQKTRDAFDVKLDDNFSEKDRLSLRFSYSRPVTYQAPLFGLAGGPGPGGAFMGTGVQNTYSTGLSYVHIFGSTLIAQFRLGLSYYHNDAYNSDYGTPASTAIGIPGANVNDFTSGLASIALGDGISSPMTGYSLSMPWDRAEVNIDLVNTWTKTAGNHYIKWGADLKRLRDNLLQEVNYPPRGIYSFGNGQTALCTALGTSPATGLATSCASSQPGAPNDMASFLLDTPASLGRDFNGYFPALRAWEFSSFVNDQWHASSKLTLNVGLRWDLYPPATPAYAGGFSNFDPATNNLVIAGVGGNPMNLGMKMHYNYFAPRIGLAYRIDSKTVVRAGFGTSYTRFSDNTYAYNYPIRSSAFYNNVGDGFASALLPTGQMATFQAGEPLPVAVPVPSNGIIPATGSLLSQSMTAINPNFKNPYVETWSIAIQRALPWHFTLDATYLGVHGVESSTQANLNTSTILGNGSANQPLNILYGKTAGVTLWFNGYSTSYNALAVKFDRRFSSGLTLTTAFTWGKGMGFNTGDDGAMYWLINPQRSYARSDWDRTLSYVQSYVYSLPFGKQQKWISTGPASWILGNWQVSGILTLMTGTPMTITASGTSLNTSGEPQTANQVAPVQILHGINVGNPWFSTASFSQPTAPLTFGTSGRNIMNGPGLFSLNLSLFKDIRIRERATVQIRAETFNFTNTPEFANPNTSVTSANFGYVTGTLGSGTGINGTGGGRAIQLGVKVAF